MKKHLRLNIRTTLFFLVFFPIIYSNSFGQCSSSSDIDIDLDCGDETYDWDGQKSSPTYLPLSVSAGIKRIFPRTFSQNRDDQGLLDIWSNPKTGYHFDVTFQPQKPTILNFGFSLNTTPLAKSIKEDIPNTEREMTFEKTSKFSNYALFGDLKIHENKRGTLFTRGSFGLSSYKARAFISGKDSCGCYKVMEDEKFKETTLISSIGIGYQFNITHAIALQILYMQNYQSLKGFTNQRAFDKWSYKVVEAHENKVEIDAIEENRQSTITNHNSLQISVSYNLNARPIEKQTEKYYVYVTSFAIDQLTQEMMNDIAKKFGHQKLFLTKDAHSYYVFHGENERFRKAQKKHLRAKALGYFESQILTHYIGEPAIFKDNQDYY
ncbi:MAG: hypothetical protein MRY83_00375 [Flavobacteriales bacterium]|nr:hypothetical protein [Flavobacteriales bacterium]